MSDSPEKNSPSSPLSRISEEKAVKIMLSAYCESAGSRPMLDAYRALKEAENAK